MALSVEITCDPARWMGYRIDDGEDSLRWTTENFTDGFHDLLIAVADSLAGQSAVVEFSDVPGASRLQLEPVGDRLQLTLMAYDAWPVRQTAGGRLLGSMAVRLRTFAGAALAEGQRLAAERQAYETASRHPFPDQRLADLAQALKKTSAGPQQ